MSAGLAAVLLMSAGCATDPTSTEKAPDQFDALYDGKAELVYATRFPATSAQEAESRGDLALRSGDVDLALLEYVTALQLGGGDPDILYKVGAIHAERDNPRLAQMAYEMALNVSKDHAGALEGLGLILVDRRQHEAAKTRLSRAVALDQNRWRAHNALGVIADLEGDYSEATSHYMAALRINPNSPKVLNNYAYSKYLAGDWDGAQQDLERALNHYPQYSRAWMNLGLILARREKYNEAFRAFRNVMNDAQAWNNVGYVCMMSGHYEDAEAFFLRAISVSPVYYASAYDNVQRVRELRAYASK